MDHQTKYKFIKDLGSGTFGNVSLYKDSNNSLVCIKKINLINSTCVQRAIKMESYIISKLRHPRIIKYLGTFKSKHSYNIVMEYASRGTLKRLIGQNHGVLSKTKILNIMYDIVMGLEYLHIRHIVHRDLKPDNILIDEHGRLKIADFGISVICMEAGATILGGTYLYLPPETVKSKKSDFKADIWALGCIFYEMCTGYNLYYGVKSFEEIKSFLLRPECSYVSCKQISQGKEYINLCERLLTFDPKRRATIHEIIVSPLFRIPFFKLYFEYN